MRRNFFVALTAMLALAVSGCTATRYRPDPRVQELSNELTQCRQEKHRLRDELNRRAVRHVVLMAFKDGTSKETVEQIEANFRDLSDKIDVIHDFEWGTDISVENLQQGYTHCFLVTFANENDRDAYLPHPAHKEFVAFITPHLEKALVLDYWRKR